MNIFTQFATQFLINKNTLVQLFKTMKLSNQFIAAFRNNYIYINEDLIRRQFHGLCQINTKQAFQDLCCHDNGIQIVFHTTHQDYRFIRFRLSFDIKLITIILNTQQQTIQFLISNIRIKSLNHLSKAVRFCIRVSFLLFIDQHFCRSMYA
jgi:hypothetical protein